MTGCASSPATKEPAVTDRYAVVGNPVAHSRVAVHPSEFARQTGQDLQYERLLAPLDGFRAGSKISAPKAGEA